MDSVLKIDRQASIQNCAEIQEQIVYNLSNSNSLTIDVSEVVEVDLSFVQLAYSTLIHASKNGLQATFTPQPNDCLSKTLERAGLPPSLSIDALNGCFHGGMPE